MIAVHKLCKAFGGKAVLQDFSCELEEGRVTALMAPSGAGKTTLLRILLGLETADSGEITGLSGKRLAAVFQEDRLLDFMTPVDNIRLPEPKIERAVILREMAAMGLTGCENQPVRELSGGMRRRVAILRALLCGADVIASRSRGWTRRRGRASSTKRSGSAGGRPCCWSRTRRPRRNAWARKSSACLTAKVKNVMLCPAKSRRKRCALYGRYEHGNHDERASRHRL